MAITYPVIECPKCSGYLAPEGPRLDGTCPGCGVQIMLEIFPALVVGPEKGAAAEHLLIADDASCFYHPDKKATIPCEVCGRFLCALCDVELNGRHTCSGCLAEEKASGQNTDLKTVGKDRRKEAFMLSVVSLFIPIIGLVMALYAIYLIAKSSKKSDSLIPKSRIWNVLTLLLSTIVIIMNIIMIIAMVVGN